MELNKHQGSESGLTELHGASKTLIGYNDEKHLYSVQNALVLTKMMQNIALWVISGGCVVYSAK
jgi:hypothetical protein